MDHLREQVAITHSIVEREDYRREKLGLEALAERDFKRLELVG